MEVTTSIERNPKAKIQLSENLLSCITSANKAIWTMFFGFKEITQSYIEHASIRVLLGNDSQRPHSVIVEIKIKGNENFQFERMFSRTFDANRDYDTEYKNLETEICRVMKGHVEVAFSDVICSFKAKADELLDEKVESSV